MNRSREAKRLMKSDNPTELKKLKLNRCESSKSISNDNSENLLKLDESLLATVNFEQLENSHKKTSQRNELNILKRKRILSSKKKSKKPVKFSQKYVERLNLSLRRRLNGYQSSGENSIAKDNYLIENNDSGNECVTMAKSLLTNTPNSNKKTLTRVLLKSSLNSYNNKMKYLNGINIDESGVGVLPEGSSMDTEKSKISDNLNETFCFDGDEYFQNAHLTQLYNTHKKETKQSPINNKKNKQNIDNDTESKPEISTNKSTHQDCFSQFCENSQVLNQIENAISSCERGKKWKQPHHNTSSENESNLASRTHSSHNSSILKNAINKLKENDDCWDESLACEVSQLFNSTGYRQEIQSVFENLETSICNIAPGQDKSLEKGKSLNKTAAVVNTSENLLNWTQDSVMENIDINESGMSSLIRRNLLNNGSRLNETSFKVHHTPINRKCHFESMGPFYGLPVKVKELIKQYKGIDQLYDWQDECLKLESIQNRKNLVYALPTSGGKTLVSEILILREALCRKKNAIFVLPYVSIVQEKVWALSPFAVALDFLIEEYAAGKGVYPPRKRRYKNSVFIATIEKALGLVNSLIENGRLKELGLMVVDELHLIGEAGRGATLEILLTKLMHAKEDIHIIGMSATIGNLPEICKFLNAEVYTRNFRPVELKEYVKCESNIFRVNKNIHDVHNLLHQERTITNNYSNDTLNKLDPDKIGLLVQEVVPNGSCLVFCATKKNCENVAQLICRAMPRQILEHKKLEKVALMNILRTEGVLCPILNKTLPYGVAYHHSGLTADERRFIEEGFRAGTVCTISCTSTLAAGVNLPAQRVILRSPYVGREFINLARYKQMAGRAGRAGFGEMGESILLCEKRDMKKVIDLLCSPMNEAVSSLHENEEKGLQNLILSCIGLGIATTRYELYKVAKKTLLAKQEERLNINIKSCTDNAMTSLFKLGAIQLAIDNEKTPDKNVSVHLQTSQINGSAAKPAKSSSKKPVVVRTDSRLVISKLGRAAIKGGLDLNKAHMLYEDLIQAQASLVLLDCLHLLYLVTPYDLAGQIKPSMSTYYSVYIELGMKELQTARVLGITEGCAVKMISGQTIKNVEPRVLNRFYLTLILYDLWNEKSVFYVAEKYQVSRGIVQQLMTSSATFAFSIVNFCEELEEFWSFAHLLRAMSQRLQHCSSKELLPLMDLPSVKQGRARQLYKAGFKNLQSIAKADPSDLVNNLDHMSRRVANQLIAAAKLLLLEKVENLREEAEDVLDGIEIPK